MSKRVSASDAKNSFGGLLDDVASLGRVEIFKHGRLVAVIMSPRVVESLEARGAAESPNASWGDKHMIPPGSARAARRVSSPASFDDE